MFVIVYLYTHVLVYTLVHVYPMYLCTRVLVYSCTRVLVFSCTRVLVNSYTRVLIYSCTHVCTRVHVCCIHDKTHVCTHVCYTCTRACYIHAKHTKIRGQTTSWVYWWYQVRNVIKCLILIGSYRFFSNGRIRPVPGANPTVATIFEKG